METEFNIDRINEAIRKVNEMNMPCSNTAALEEYERNNRDETPEEEAELMERVESLAKEKIREDGFIWDSLGEIPDAQLEAIGIMAMGCNDDLATQAAIGKTFIAAIREYAIKCARQELNV